MEINTVGVVGAGTMGRGITQNLLGAGFQVVLFDRTPEILLQAIDSIHQGLRLQTLLGGQSIQDHPDTLRDRIKTSVDYQDLSGVDLVIESVTENFLIKKEVYKKLDIVCKNGCIFVANTSAIPISKIASVTTRPDRVIGIHFMNPVPLMSAVEVIVGINTSTNTLELIKVFLKSIGKESVVVNDSPGFVTNRVLMLSINEAIALLNENVASAESIDSIFKKCFSHKMGPLELADMIGLDVIVDTLKVLQDSFEDKKYQPNSLLQKMVDDGHLGRKSGSGFYKYHFN